MNLNHIICFPSISSTLKDNKPFIPTYLGKTINNQGVKNIYKVRMILIYNHEKGDISPGILLLNNIGKDNKTLSSHPEENEVMLFPFTFARVIKIREVPMGEREF